MKQIRFDEKFRLVVPLEAQSPMIHFQARETGATIRATEVKPKFDRFLWKRINERKLNSAGMIQKQSDSDQRDAVPSLKYRMRIYCPEPPQVVSINNGSVKSPDGRSVKLQDYSYSLFYGNSGKPTLDDQTMGILSNPVLEIQCLNAGLRELIEESVTEFFLTTNFGTMQSKGFGSFSPSDFCDDDWLNDAQRAEIAGYLKAKTGTDICYYMQMKYPYYDAEWDASVKDFTDTFEAIRCFYQLMKSGYNQARSYGESEYERSFLFQYMHDLGIGNEKAWMKREHISPAVYTSRRTAPPMENQDKFYYVRALLGTTGNVSYQTEDRRRVNVTISGELQRVSSPVFFKVVKDTVFITAFPVPKEVYGQIYTFTGDRRRGYESGEISTPEAELFASRAFDTRDFMERYVEHYNRLIRENRLPKFLKYAKEVRPL